jgi:DNA-binding transcriptional LysR family regulator
MQIKQLQSSLDLNLFMRTPRGLTLTADGRALLPLAERAIEAVTALWQHPESRRAKLRGKLTIGTALLDPAFTQLSMVFRCLAERHPEVETELRHGMLGWVLENIRSSALEAGFYIGQPPAVKNQPEYDVLSLSPFLYHVVAPRGWDARVKGKDWAELAAMPWIWTPEGSIHNQLLTRQFAGAGVTPNMVAVVDREAPMLELLRAGVGLSLVRDTIAKYEAQVQGLFVADLTIPTELSFIALKARREEPMVAAIFQLVREIFKL